MKKAKKILLQILHFKPLKYIVVTLFAVVFIGFVDENSVYNHFRNKIRISELEDEIRELTDRYNRDEAQIRLLDSDPKAMEKIARERYFMKAADEDIFVLSDDPSTSSILGQHETID